VTEAYSLLNFIEVIIISYCCCNLSGGVALIVWFTTNGMCTKNNNIYIYIYVVRTSNNKVIVARDLYCCLLPQCEALRTCRSGFRLQLNGAVTRMWKSCRVKPSRKERAISAVRFKKKGMLLQPLQWRCVDCVIHHERDVHEEQQYIYEWHEQAIIEW